MPDLLQAGNAYELLPAELPALRSLLLFQNTDLTTRALTTNDMSAFFACVDRLSRSYPGAINARHKGYHDGLFNELCALDHIVAAYITDKYYQYAEPIWAMSYFVFMGINSYWKSYLYGCDFDTFTGNHYHFDPGVTTPDHPPQWTQKITTTRTGLGKYPSKLCH